MTYGTLSQEEAAALRDSEARYRMLFENSLDALMLTAPDGSILDANPSACRILGRSREEILRGGRKGVIDTSDPRLATLLEERARTGKAHGELRARRKDGSLFPVELSSVVFRDPDGNPRTCIILRDITDRKAAEAERERLIAELKEALSKVRMLSGLLPICASCKKIRDPKGTWQHLESYIRDNSEAEFTHGICPDCRQQLYPEHFRG
ncbi:MAG: PAS domain S-box protein [Acidobacteriia bacterium]|nr:PAS domain S-box protein [Terriglobia bacterium]